MALDALLERAGQQLQPYTAVGDALIVGDILYGSTQMKNMFP
jgi:hypothetical protein